MNWTLWFVQVIIVEKFVKQPHELNKWCDCFNSSKRDASCILPKHLFTTNCTTTVTLFPFRRLVIKFLQQSCEGFLLNIPSLSSSTQFDKFRNIAVQLFYFLGFGLGLQILIFNLHLIIELTGDFWISQSISANLFYQVTVVRMKLEETSYKQPWIVREKWDLNPSFSYWFTEFLLLVLSWAGTWKMYRFKKI